MVYGLWSMVYGLWSMVYGLWSMVYGLWSMVYGLWSMVYGYGLWSEIKFWSNKSVAIEISKTGEAKGIKFSKLT